MRQHKQSGSSDVLEVCTAIEMARAQLFHLFADLFKGERESLLLWLNAAMEEENHARLFTLMAKLRSHGIIDSIHLERAEAEAALKHIRSLIRKVKKSPPTHEEALLMAINLENRFHGIMVKEVITFADESYAKLFLPVTKSDIRCLETLQQAYERIVAQPQPA